MSAAGRNGALAGGVRHKRASAIAMNAVHRAGMAAKGYSYNGYAYKSFSEGYPKEEIECEYNLQQEVVKSGLPIPNYYRSEFPTASKWT